jgi:hypothetical protein
MPATCRRWFRTLALVFPAALLLGSGGCCTLKCREATAPIVDVESADRVSRDPVVISKRAGQSIVWRLPSGSTISRIAITLGGNPAPFEDCQTTEGYCRIACHDRTCASGPIVPSLEVPGGGLYYAYAFEHAAGTVSSDPGIRIDP